MRKAMNPQSGNLEHLLKLHAMGLCLVPLAGKRAIVKNWPELHLGEHNIRELCARVVNWGIITGDPLIVLDTDSALAEALLQETGMASTTVVRSGRGGFHHYFRALDDADIRSKTRFNNVPGLDLKAWRSYIVAAGSIHPETGKRYAYVPGREFTNVDCLPIFRHEWVIKPARDGNLRPGDLPRIATRGRINDIFAYLLKVESVQGEQGSNGCYRVCCLLRDEGYSAQEAWPILLWWNERKPVPRWSTRELVHKLESVYWVPLRAALNE